MTYGVKEVFLQDRECLRSGRAEVVRGSSEEEGESRVPGAGVRRRVQEHSCILLRGEAGARHRLLRRRRRKASVFIGFS